MSIYWNNIELEKYMKMYRPNEKRPRRSITAEEVAMVRDFQTISRGMGILVTELLSIIFTLKQFDNPDLKYINSNLGTMVQSLVRQRDYIFALKGAFFSIKPSEVVRKEILRSLLHMEKRIDFIRSTMVPTNIAFTPIKEYLEISGKATIGDDLLEWFGSHAAMIEASENKDSEEFSKYAKHIANALAESGKASEYESRLHERAEKIGQVVSEAKKEKMEQKRAAVYEQITEGMMDFCRMFSRAVTSVQGNNTIHMSRTALTRKINMYGDGCYFVLCCYTCKKQLRYCYLGEEGQLVKTFFSARAFDNETEATEAKKQAGQKYAEHCFEVVGLRY